MTSAPTDRDDVARTLRDAGLDVPDEEIDELTEGVAILRRLADKLAGRGDRNEDGDG